MIYPAIVRAVSFGKLPASQVAKFAAMATRFERLAFGPPIESVERVLALVRAGVVDFRFAAGPSIEQCTAGLSGNAAGWSMNGTAVDVLVDARIASPGVRVQPSQPDAAHGVRESLLASLVKGGTVEVDPDWQAVRTDRYGFAAPHLAIIGRAAEGWVLGHDTLTRTLHDQIPRWARVVSERTTMAVVPRRKTAHPVAMPVAAAVR